MQEAVVFSSIIFIRINAFYYAGYWTKIAVECFLTSTRQMFQMGRQTLWLADTLQMEEFSLKWTVDRRGKILWQNYDGTR